MGWEYQVTFLKMPYHEGAKGVFSDDPTTHPDIEKFLSSLNTKDHLSKMGDEGWELVSTQDVLRGHWQTSNTCKWGYGYSLTNGFVLFWKRKKQ